MVPFIMRNEPEHTRLEAIALHFTTWSTTTFLLGAVSYGGRWLLGTKLPEHEFLLFVSGVGILGLLLSMTKISEVLPEKPKSTGKTWQNYDWPVLVTALVPSLIIGIGAGLTIPFINLFFLHTFQLSYEEFAILPKCIIKTKQLQNWSKKASAFSGSITRA